MIYEHRGRSPHVDGSAWISPEARLYGDVTVGPGTVVLAGSTVAAQGAPVVLGSHCVIMEGAVIRGVPGHPCEIGSHVLVGPRSHLSGCVVEELSFVATGATVLNGARIGRLADVRINAVIHVRTRLPPETTVPIGWVAVGDPAEIHPPGRHDEIWAVQRTLGFRDAAFRMGDLPRDRFMERMTRSYARALAHHAADRPLAGADGSGTPGRSPDG